VRVTLYSLDGCGHCDAAREKLDLLGVGYDEVDVLDAVEGEGEGGDRVRAALYANENRAPLIEVGGELLGYPAAMRAIKTALVEGED
jgi:glutaredoxin